MTDQFSCKVIDSHRWVDAEDRKGVIRVPSIALHYTHNGYQWTVANMLPEEWKSAISAIQLKIDPSQTEPDEPPRASRD